MTALLPPLLLVLVFVLLGRPLLRRPLSEDDGNWYYHACFRDRGVRPYGEMTSTYGYFGLFGLSALLFGPFRGQGPAFFPRLKFGWYLLNVLSVYGMTLVWSDRPGLALTAGLLYTVATALPNTLFFLTYAEHLMVLPLNLALLGLHLGLSGAGTLWFLAAGLAAGWAVQIKPTALLAALALLAACGAGPSPAADGVLCLTGVLLPNLLPCLILAGDRQAVRAYLQRTFGGAAGLATLLLGRISPALVRRLVPEGLRSGASFAYLAGHHRLTGREQWEAFRRFMGPALGDLRLVLFLAALQAVGLFPGRFDALTLAMGVLAALCLLMQQLQKNYYTPHFNTLWLPLSVLAAKTLWEAAGAALAGGLAGGLVLLVVLLETPRLAGRVAAALRPQALETVGFLGPLLGGLASLARTAGTAIRDLSRPSDRLLVWGDHPAVYLYADRPCFHADYLFLYTHMRRLEDEGEQDRFLEAFRRRPPEWVLFFHYQFADGWTMARLEEAAGIPYLPVTRFQLQDPQGQTLLANDVPLSFPLYRRDDRRYREILLERAAFALQAADREAYGRALDQVLALDPGDPEGRIRRQALEEAGAGAEDLRRHLEGRREADPARAALVALLLADLDRQAGQLAPAARRYAAAREGQPGDFRLFNGLSELAYAQGDRKGSLRFLEEAYRLNPFSAELNNNLGVLYSLAGERDKARRFFQKALRLVPGYRDALENLETLCAEGRTP